MIVRFKNGEFDLYDGDIIMIMVEIDEHDSYIEVVKCEQSQNAMTYLEFGDEWNYKFDSLSDSFIKKIKISSK